MHQIVTKIQNLGPSSSQMKAALFLLLTGIALTVLVANRGVNYAYYQQTQILQLPLTVDSAYLLGFAGNAHVSGVDSANLQVRYQGISTGEFQEIVQRISAEFPDEVITTYESTEFLPVGISFRLVYGIAIGLLVVWIGAYWTVTRKVEKTLRRAANKLFLSIVVSWLVISIVGLGLLSLLSSFYELKEVTFVVFGMVSLLMYFLTSIGWYQLSLTQGGRGLATEFRENINSYTSILPLLIGVICLPLLAGLGTNILPEIGFLLLYVLFMSYAILELPTLFVSFRVRGERRMDAPKTDSKVNSPVVKRDEKKKKHKSVGPRKRRGRRL